MMNMLYAKIKHYSLQKFLRTQRCIFIILAFITILMYVKTYQTGASIFLPVVGMLVFTIGVLAPISSGSLMKQEMQHNTWDFLILTNNSLHYLLFGLTLFGHI